MDFHDIVINDLELLSEVLGPHFDDLLFLGGSSVGFFLPVIRRADLRFSVDRDFIVSVATYLDFHEFEQKLAQRGLQRDSSSKINCRWRYGNMIIDVMPAHPIQGYPTNEWYQLCFAAAEIHTLKNGKKIKLISPVHFLATKLTAFASRGKLNEKSIYDPEMNKDLEDIIHVVEGRDGILEELKKAETRLKSFVSSNIANLLKNKLLEDFVGNCFRGGTRNDQIRNVLLKLSAISKL